MNKLFRSVLTAAALLALSSCAAIIPKEHLIPEDRLVGTMQQQFPLRWEKAGGLLGITISQPQLTLNPAQNRLGISGRFVAHAVMIDVGGDFSSSSSLRYDQKQRAVFLQGANLDSLRLEQQGNRYTEMLRTEISRILKDYASSHPVYRFKPDELTVLGVQVEVGGISVVPEGLMLSLHAVQADNGVAAAPVHKNSLL